jgi:hypothetical protein
MGSKIQEFAWRYEIQFGNFFQISVDFELTKDSRKTDLNGLWSDRLIEILTPNVRELDFGQGLIHGDL